ncbi:hypothetical protein F4820DRAFT_347654 [Hypoxylon rubiginosum]|uniref:Uncharacterized protein n=1 Tax=Hypoxylon rubiginosum TaxID=110542 RepID=A0ACB9YXG9_9PEZI|nr:hypothetical protein F4820DRAFT_347654 [Hypoxylon rubiginosum]
MPWPPHRRHRSAPSRLRYQDLFALRTDIPALSVTPASTNHSIELIEPTTPFLPGPRNVSILSPTNEQAALFGAGIASNQYGNDLLGFSNEYHFNLGAAEATFTQQPPTRNEVHRWNGTNTWTGSLQASPGLPLQYPSQPQLWANAPGHSFQSSPTLDPSLSQGLEPGGSSHSGNIQSHSPETASSPQELRLTREDMSTLTSRHEDWQTHAPLYLLNTTEKEIRVMMTRGDRTKVSAIAKPTRNVRNIFISRRMAKQLGLKIHPIAKQKRRQYLTPNGRENPVGFVEFDIESEAYDIHPTHVSAMVLNDSYNSLTAICLGVKFLEKAFGTKLLKTDRLSEIPKGTVDTNSVASYTMAQAFNSRMISRSGPKNPLGKLKHAIVALFCGSDKTSQSATCIINMQTPKTWVGWPQRSSRGNLLAVRRLLPPTRTPSPSYLLARCPTQEATRIPGTLQPCRREYSRSRPQRQGLRHLVPLKKIAMALPNRTRRHSIPVRLGPRAVALLILLCLRPIMGTGHRLPTNRFIVLRNSHILKTRCPCRAVKMAHTTTVIYSQVLQYLTYV